MTGYTCNAHVATTIKGRVPVLCRRWIPSFAHACTECGASRDRGGCVFATLGRVLHSHRGGDVEKTVRRMAESHKAARRSLAR